MNWSSDRILIRPYFESLPGSGSATLLFTPKWRVLVMDQHFKVSLTDKWYDEFTIVRNPLFSVETLRLEDFISFKKMKKNLRKFSNILYKKSAEWFQKTGKLFPLPWIVRRLQSCDVRNTGTQEYHVLYYIYPSQEKTCFLFYNSKPVWISSQIYSYRSIQF